MEEIQKLKKFGYSYLHTLSEDVLSKMIRIANINYYIKKQSMSDDMYDLLKDFITKKFPSNTSIQMIGAPIEKNKVKLPYEMWSMNKRKGDAEIGKVPGHSDLSWDIQFPGEKVITMKLDGVSGLYSTEGEIPKLYTRGNGQYGQDVSHLIPFLQLPTEKNITIRGEFLIKKDLFKQKYNAANARSFVSGTINLKTPNPSKYVDLDFVAYEVIHPSLKPSEQLEFLKQLNVIVVNGGIYSTYNEILLSEILQKYRTDYEYEIDGVIVTDNKIYERKSENPKHSFAFKMNLLDQTAESEVIDVIWTPSKDGLLKPRVQFKPVIINGVKLQFASGYNAKFIKDNCIGTGTIVRVIRSGDVIPTILMAWGGWEAKMPESSWNWNESGVEAVLSDPTSNTIVNVKNITHFFTKLEIDGLGIGNIKQIIAAGYDSIPKILKMTKKDFLKCDGFQETKAKKISRSIKRQLKECSLPRFLAATNLMGRGIGERRLKTVLQKYPNILTVDSSQKIQMVQTVEGFGQKTSSLFVEQIPQVIDFMKKTHTLSKLNNNTFEKSIAKIKTIVFSGIRPESNLHQKIIQITGTEISNNITKNTALLVVKNKLIMTSKLKKAKKMGIPIKQFDTFMQQLNQGSTIL